MSKHPRLMRRGAVYYFRCKIPADLIDHYRKREIVESLRTNNATEALRKVRARSERQEQEFDKIRAAREVTEFTREEVQHAIDLWTAHRLKADEEMRFAGLSREMFERLGRMHTEDELTARDALARGAREAVEERMADFLQGNGYRLPPKSSHQYKMLAHAFLKANVMALKAMQERDRGEIVETPQPANAARQRPRKASSATLSDLLVRWEKERHPTARARQEWEFVVRRFGELNGKLPVDLIEKRHVLAYKDQMMADSAAPATINKHLAALGSLLQLAAENDLCAANVAKGIRVRGSKVSEESRLPYDTQDLKHIFSSPVFTKGERPTGGAGDAALWLPLLALFTGARLEELGQAGTEDVKDVDGVLVLEISDRGEGKSVKTESSRRRVPIHRTLLDLGFLDYVEARRKAEDDRLFPGLNRNKYGRWTPAWSKWWGRYARQKANIVDPRKVFHSFRHTFKDACRACHIPEEVHDALTGHSGGGVGRSYGGLHYPLAPLVEAMKKLRYPGLDLRHLRPQTRTIQIA